MEEIAISRSLARISIRALLKEQKISIKKMKLSLLQTDIFWADKQANFDKTEKTLSSLSGTTDLVVLPEMFSTGFCTNRPDLAEPMDGETVQTLTACAIQFNLALTGSFIATENGKLYNRAFFVTPDGEMTTADKRHLFSMGKEDEIFSAGNDKLMVHYKGLNIFILVCYDIRFPVWSRNVNNAYDLLIYVANFPHVRMPVWDTLLKARAIENQAYVCGVNRVGTDGMQLEYSGHSALLDAKGNEMLSFGEYEEGVKTTEISKTELDRFRQKFAVWKDADRFELKN